MTTLIAGGDSYVYGLELADCVQKGDYDYSTYTFPALLAKTYNLDYTCVAIPGYSNSAIARSVVNECLTRKENLVVLVAWTYTNRFEVSTEFPLVKPLNYTSNVWYGISPASIERKRKDYPEFIRMVDEFLKYTGLTKYYQYYTTLKEILYLQNFLKVHDIPYLFTSADNAISFQKAGDIIEHDDNVDTLKNMLNEVDWQHWQLFPHNGVDWLSTNSPNSFRSWANENKFEFGPEKHPLEQAHVHAHDIFKDRFNELVAKVNLKD